ncbi:MAG: tetratricopeptide repeat protein [Candidatus Rokuibacteriota bacterium]
MLLLLLLAILHVGCAALGLPTTPASRPAPPAELAAPADPAPAEARAHLERGQALIAHGQMAAAVTSLRDALRLHPDLVEARASLGHALYGLGDLDGAIEEFRALLRARPDVSSARLGLATALMARRDWLGARAELDEVLRRQPDLLQAHYSLGIVRYTLGDLDGAIEAYRRVLELEPRHGDARYNLALALKVARRDAEAAGEFLAAAEAGLPKAHYFMGTSYATGAGVERNLVLAIAAWNAAADGGVPQAREALARLRQMALGKGRHTPAERQAATQAFTDFRAGLWNAFPDLARTAEDDAVGVTLLREGRVREAVPMLIREASALSDSAQAALEALYEQGVEGQLPAHDARILRYLEAAAMEGQLRPRLEVARIYAGGLGVPKDVDRAIRLLKATPHEDAQRLLRELSGTRDGVR